MKNYTFPAVGSKRWIKELRQATKSPRFKITLSKNCLEYKIPDYLTTSAKNRLVVAQQELQNLVKIKK